MQVCLNGLFMPAEDAKISIFDRGVLYGDSLFETMRVTHRRIFRWHSHWVRLTTSASMLEMRIPWSEADLLSKAEELVLRNGLPEGVLRLTISRGVGLRGYSPVGADTPIYTLTLHPIPEGPATKWKLMTASQRIPSGIGLDSLKSGNKLRQVLAKGEASRVGADEAVLLDSSGSLAEGSASNIFWIESETVLTPPESTGLLPGITRAVVGELCCHLGIRLQECLTPPQRAREASGVFCTLSTLGIVEVRAWDNQSCELSPITRRLQMAYSNLVHS